MIGRVEGSRKLASGRQGRIKPSPIKCRSAAFSCSGASRPAAPVRVATKFSEPFVCRRPTSRRHSSLVVFAGRGVSSCLGFSLLSCDVPNAHPFACAAGPCVSSTSSFRLLRSCVCLPVRYRSFRFAGQGPATRVGGFASRRWPKTSSLVAVRLM